ncbi:MAG: type II toxin-antitoxin system VapB family antitoxin [Actinomycetota bacterium]
MRTTLDIDDRLLRALLARHPGLTKRAAVEIAIRQYVTEEATDGVRRLAGTLEVEDVTPERKSDRAT